jgi:hypothetical protein
LTDFAGRVARIVRCTARQPEQSTEAFDSATMQPHRVAKAVSLIRADGRAIEPRNRSADSTERAGLCSIVSYTPVATEPGGWLREFGGRAKRHGPE